MSGYVYILTNPSFRDDWVKIGKSSRPVNIRSKELDNTAVPLQFEIYAVMKTEKYSEAEKQIHGLIDIVNPGMRIRKGREFFVDFILFRVGTFCERLFHLIVNHTPIQN